MSSLAAQLQGIASLDAARLTSRYGQPSSKSYLFPPKVASTHDLDSIFALAQSGFEELLTLDPEVEQYEAEVFSEKSKRTDRMMLSQEENDELNILLARCLRRLGKWIGIMAGGKCIEWLVRRFRVHELNAETLLQVFLPYHESPNFPRMLAILTLPQTSRYYAPFAPLIKNAQPLSRSYITTAISPTRDKSLKLLGDIAGMVQIAVKERVVHRALLTFWTATMVDLLEGGKQGKVADEGLVKVMVEAFVTILSTKNGGEDVNAAVYPPLVLLTRSINLTDEAFHAIVSSLSTPTSGANPSQRILTMLVILNDRPGFTAGLGDAASQNLSSVKQLDQILVASMEKYGFETALKSVIGVLLEDPELHFKAIRAVLEYRELPRSIAKLAAASLLQLGSDEQTSEETKDIVKSLLVNLRERHPTIVDSVYVEASATAQIDHQLVQKPADESAYLNIYAADVSSRVQGIKEVMQLHRSGSKDESAVTALVARLGDADEAVIEAIYEDPEQLLEITFVDKYISGVKPSFWSSAPKPAIIGHHLNYISNTLLTDKVRGKYPNTGRQIFQELLFPILLAVEKKSPLSSADADRILGGDFGNIELLSSITPDIIQARSQSDREASPRSNLLLASSLSAAILASSHYDQDIKFLISQIDSTNASAKLLSLLVLSQLMISAQGEKQMVLASQVLDHIKLRQSVSLREIEYSEDGVSSTLLDAIYRRPADPRTSHRAFLSLLAAMTKVHRPSTSITWLDGDIEVSGPKASYKSIANEIYAWSNSGSLPALLASSLLRSLFAQLGEDALLFFASIWTSQSSAALKTASLRHAFAFVSAYSGMKALQGIDFQIMVSSVVIALQDSEKSVRSAGVDLLKTMSVNAQNSENIYALDTIYGSRSDTVQLLKPSDRKKYLDTLVEASDESTLDNGRLKTVHTAALVIIHGKNKKETAHRRAVLGCLISHIISHRCIRDRLALLRLIAEVYDHSVLRGVLPLLLALQDVKNEETVWLNTLKAVDRHEYLALLMSTFSKESVSLFADDQAGAWDFMLSALQNENNSVLSRQLRDLALQRMVDGVFNALPGHQKIEYVLTIVESLHALSGEVSLATSKLLQSFHLDTSSIVEILEHLSEPLETTVHRKKQRNDDVEDDKPTSAVLDLTILIESRDWQSLPGDATLVASLMSILSALLAKRQYINQGVDYLEQEVLAAILALVEKIQDPQEIGRAHVGIEVIIKVIRASTNPRTSQRALLVASELARLIPEAVLHNIMPIFTFMGASDFQRDDAYSFGVVEKTVSRIVPVMTKSLKEKAENSLELYNESLTFLSIFTDMAGRLPKHRTLPFFVHLVKSLGPEDFLAPICMLLVDRATTKAGRSGNPVSVVLDLPASLGSSFDITIRTEVLASVVDELTRLVHDLSESEKEAFLSRTISENDSSDRPIKQINHLLTFGLALIEQLKGKQCTQSTVQPIVQNLIQLAAKTSQATLVSTDISKNVQAALSGTMQLLSAENFLTVILHLISEGTDKDVVMALNTFSGRVSLIRSDIRSKCSKIIGDILKKASTCLGSASETTKASLAAITTIASTATSTEDSALASIVPALVSSVTKLAESNNSISALELIETLVRHLGSRIIPYIQSIITLAISLISSPKTIASIAKSSFSILSALVEVVSSFISGKQLINILKTTLDYRSKDLGISLKVSTTISKKIKTKTLFPVLLDLWKTTQDEENSETIKGFFDLLRLTLKNASRDELPGMMKNVFAFFLDVFDLRHRLQSRQVDSHTINDIEESAIGSFLELVTKLNEATFKPLFIRLYDWAVIDLAEGKAIDDDRLIERKIVLLHVMMGLLVKFKNLLSPYMAALFPYIQELLPAYAEGIITHRGLHTLLLEVLAKSFEVDDGAYWTDQLLLQILPNLISQIPIYPSGEPESEAIAECLASLAKSTTSENVLRRLNSSICLTTRSDDVQTRLSALKVLDRVWEKQMDEMISFVPETVSEFLAELLEDESHDVELAARGVLARIEKITGSLKEYLE
ncbi:uncharacterized protein I303_108543 [Kwoniella dejecticola CBS 10117]|uniref:U3 small nucleolar RNA-associated protein 10 n=1 Tax=Kwoniella dejecticola CBS 10117 TaxID=1296121 RepID=A0A1A5ZX39_9TREE|nr:uncharacterized protein I303_07133 [Kwoniella dejecticola CBS 10117]OBR82374.1 hypothetical protein I303_07133 [Kwoniella dejecticola CBS 10117]